MDEDQIYIPETWSAVAGYVPLLEAEARLEVCRRALSGIAALIDSLEREAVEEAADELRFIRADPAAAEYERETTEYLEERVLGIRGELPPMLHGVQIVYLFSVLESCLEAAAAIRGAPPPRGVGNPKLEGYLAALREQGVAIEWDADTWRELRRWRSVRNAIAHRLERPEVAFGGPGGTRGGADARPLSAAGLESLLGLIEDAIEALDLAMHRLTGRPAR